MRQLFFLISLLTLGIAGFAIADSKTVQDRREAPDNKLDIKSASAAHAGRKLKHEVVLWGAVPDRFHGQVCVTVQSRRVNVGAPQRPDYGARSICILNKKQERVDIVQMQTGKVKGHARVKYPRKNRVRFLFGKKAIGSPTRYFWRADTFFSSSKKNGACPKNPKGYSCFDNAPEVGSEKKHAL